jgi:triacylglycerol lipase
MRHFITACAVLIALLTSSFGALAADTYTKTKYPIVLVHGLLGFDSIAGVEYFYGIPSELRRSGATVYTASVSQSNSTEVRGEQLLRELQMLQAWYGHTKFNLIGHSHGGNTIRYVASVAPWLVGSVTTVGTPHQGSKVADMIAGLTDATGTTGIVADIMNALSKMIAFASGSGSNPQNAIATLHSLSTAGAQEFNHRYPQGAPYWHCGPGPESVNGVRYYSMGGTDVLTNRRDISDALLYVNSLVFGLEENDGLVSRCSSRWGRVLRDNYAWNHFDEVNQVFGLRGLLSADPVSVYRAQANRLKEVGL